MITFLMESAKVQVPSWVVDLYRSNFDNYAKSEYY